MVTDGAAWRRFLLRARDTRSCSPRDVSFPPLPRRALRVFSKEMKRKGGRGRGGDGARSGIDVPSCSRNYSPACSRDAVVLNWLTATKFDGGVCFSSFILILREFNFAAAESRPAAIRMHFVVGHPATSRGVATFLEETRVFAICPCASTTSPSENSDSATSVFLEYFLSIYFFLQ